VDGEQSVRFAEPRRVSALLQLRLAPVLEGLDAVWLQLPQAMILVPPSEVRLRLAQRFAVQMLGPQAPRSSSPAPPWPLPGLAAATLRTCRKSGASPDSHCRSADSARFLLYLPDAQ